MLYAWWKSLSPYEIGYLISVTAMRFLFDVSVNDQMARSPFCFDPHQHPEPGAGSASDYRWK